MIVTVIVGITGLERYLADVREVEDLKFAKKFRSEASAKRSAEEWIATFAPHIRRQMKFRVEVLETA